MWQGYRRLSLSTLKILKVLLANLAQLTQDCGPRDGPVATQIRAGPAKMSMGGKEKAQSGGLRSQGRSGCNLNPCLPDKDGHERQRNSAVRRTAVPGTVRLQLKFLPSLNDGHGQAE